MHSCRCQAAPAAAVKWRQAVSAAAVKRDRLAAALCWRGAAAVTRGASCRCVGPALS